LNEGTTFTIKLPKENLWKRVFFYSL
jgi:hypothetical protein